MTGTKKSANFWNKAYIPPLSDLDRVIQEKDFDQNFDQNNPDRWLRTYHQNFDLWLDSSEPPERETAPMELVLAKLPSRLEG